MKKSWALLLFFVFFFSENLARAEEPIRIQLGGEPSTLDPSRVMDQYGFGILRNVVEGLYTLDADGRLIKGLAASHKLLNKDTLYRFTLRADAKWSDGKAVTADDFVFSFRRLMDPATASPNVEYFFAIKNARDVFEGKKPAAALAVRREKDELVIELEKPDPLFLLELTLPSAAPLRQDEFSENGGKWDHRMPVTGDYIIKSFRPAETIELMPNPQKPAKGQRPVLYRILQEEVTALNLLESGLLDVVSTVPLKDIDRLTKAGFIQSFPSTTVFYFSFNVTKPPFDNLTWRRAIAASLDRDGLVKTLNGAYAATTSYIPSSLGGSGSAKASSFKKEMESVRAEKKKAKVRIAFGSSAFTRIVTEKVQGDLSNRLGLNVELDPKELKVLLGQLKSDPPEMYFLGMSAVFDDALHHLHAFTSHAAPNFSRYRSPAYEDLLEKMNSVPVGPRRNALAREADRILIEKDAVVVPVVLRTQVFGVSPALKNFKVSPYQVIPLAHLRK